MVCASFLRLYDLCEPETIQRLSTWDGYETDIFSIEEALKWTAATLGIHETLTGSNVLKLKLELV